MKITTIGLDLAKSVFQAHGVDENGETVLTKKLDTRKNPEISTPIGRWGAYRPPLRPGSG